MRILHADTGREMRGGQWQVYYLCQGLAECGHTTILLTPRNSRLWAVASGAGIDVRPLGLPRLWKLSRQVDLLHAHTSGAHSLAALTSGAPLVVARRVAFTPGAGRMSRWKYGRANHYIAVSAFVKMQLVAAGVPDQKINIVHDGVPVLEPSGLDGPIVAPATEDPRKGTDIVRKLARRRNLEIRFSTDLRQDLAAARVFLYLTRAEGLGSGVLLAMSAGVPVVASRVGGLPEVIQHGVTGWLTENDPEAAGEAVERLLARPEWAAQLGGRAREVVRQRFTIDVMVRNTAAVYERVARC